MSILHLYNYSQKTALTKRYRWKNRYSYAIWKYLSFHPISLMFQNLLLNDWSSYQQAAYFVDNYSKFVDISRELVKVWKVVNPNSRNKRISNFNLLPIGLNSHLYRIASSVSLFLWFLLIFLLLDTEGLQPFLLGACPYHVTL